MRKSVYMCMAVFHDKLSILSSDSFSMVNLQQTNDVILLHTVFDRENSHAQLLLHLKAGPCSYVKEMNAKTFDTHFSSRYHSPCSPRSSDVRLASQTFT